MQQSGIAGIARMPSTRNVARQICSLEPACELNIAPQPGNLRRVRWGACVARAARADDQSGGGLPQELQQARRVKTLGLAASVTVLTAGAAAALAAGMRPPQDVLWTLSCGVAFVPLGLATAKAALGDDLHIEWHDGRAWIEYAAKDPTRTLHADAIEVRPTTDGRGNGAFAAAPIARGTFIGEYEGDMLGEAQYWSRYPSGMSDYCIRVDGQWTIDGAERAADTASFSACHMNHGPSATRNVVRQTLRRERRVVFYACRDIPVGEELLLDYGFVYWTGREDEIVS